MTSDEAHYRDHLDRAFAHLERAEPFAERLLAVNPFVARFFALGFAALEDSVFAVEHLQAVEPVRLITEIFEPDPEDDDDPPEEDQTPLLVEEPEHGGEARAGEAVGA